MLSVPVAIHTMHSPATILGDRGLHVVEKTAKPTSQARTAVLSDERVRHTEWLNWVLARTGKTDSGLAKAAGQSENVLTRFRSRDGATLSSLTIRLITELTGLPGPESYKLPNLSGFSEETIRYEHQGSTSDPIQRMIAQAIEGRPNASPWLLKSRALEAVGYFPGDILIADQSVSPMAGDVVCAQIYDIKGMTAETVFRLFEPPYLIAASSDASLRKPQLIDNERVLVMATVTETFRPRRH
jgi:hypothetical protein